jgi:hypothetical protein
MRQITIHGEAWRIDTTPEAKAAKTHTRTGDRCGATAAEEEAAASQTLAAPLPATLPQPAAQLTTRQRKPRTRKVQASA